MEKIKSKIDLHKTFLNHLLVLIVSIGAGTVNMFLKSDFNLMFFCGLVILFSFLVTYGILAYRLNNDLKSIKE